MVSTLEVVIRFPQVVSVFWALQRHWTCFTDPSITPVGLFYVEFCFPVVVWTLWSLEWTTKLKSVGSETEMDLWSRASIKNFKTFPQWYWCSINFWSVKGIVKSVIYAKVTLHRLSQLKQNTRSRARSHPQVLLFCMMVMSHHCWALTTAV